MGGVGARPTYENYTTGNNFSETVRLFYDNASTSYADLLDAYWKFVSVPVGDCTWDYAYCSRIFYVDAAQKAAAEASLAAHQQNSTEKLNVAVLRSADYTFWKGEEEQQQYMKKMGEPCGASATSS